MISSEITKTHEPRVTIVTNIQVASVEIVVKTQLDAQLRRRGLHGFGSVPRLHARTRIDVKSRMETKGPLLSAEMVIISASPLVYRCASALEQRGRETPIRFLLLVKVAP